MGSHNWKILVSTCLLRLSSVSSSSLLVPTLRNDNSGADVTDVIAALQGPIAEAVAAALAGQTLGSGISGESLGSVGPRPTGSIRPVTKTYPPAQYVYEYKVANDLTQTYINQKEKRDGLEVEGSYSYVDPTGSIVTVNYTAGVNGYNETRERQEGAVDIRPASVRPSVTSGPSDVDIDQLVATILASIQPQIQNVVNDVVF